MSDHEEPLTPATATTPYESQSRHVSSPPTSLSSMSAAEQELDDDTAKEEQRIRAQYAAEEHEREQELAKEREKDLAGGEAAIDPKWQKLMRLVNQSQVGLVCCFKLPGD
jgi:hypothetical protein